MALGLHLRGRNERISFERTFSRTPLLIGRDVPPTQCVLEDNRVSKLHASIDVRGGGIWVRDAGSRNGTYVGERRLESDRWVEVGPASRPIELRIATWIVVVYACEVDVAAESVRSSTLGQLIENLPNGATVAPHQATVAAPETLHAPELRGRAAEATFDMHGGVARLAGSYARAIGALNDLYAALTRELEAVPPGARALVRDQIAAAYPRLLSDPSFAALFRHYGWQGPVPTASSPLAAAALEALQDLAGWYVGRARVFGHVAEIYAFKDKIRAALDEFFLGYVPLLAGMNRFERQMALRSDEGAPLPSSPAELAMRLLDWRPGGEDLPQRLRASFAELMMHEVALLNGVMRGVSALLTELAPATIEKAAQREGKRRPWWSRMFGGPDPWSTYKRRHSDLADEENERFRLLFGSEFVEEYRQYAREARETRELEGGRPQLPTPPPPRLSGSMPPPRGGAGGGVGAGVGGGAGGGVVGEGTLQSPGQDPSKSGTR